MAASWLVHRVAYGLEPPVDFQLAVLRRGTLALCAVGAVMTWRLFMRLEAIDGRGPDLQPPAWMRWRATDTVLAPALTKRHAIWLLVKKELRLQQMAFAVAAVGALGWFTIASRHRGEKIDDVFGALTFAVAAMNAILIGSLASAEERQLGTLEWHLLLPVATWKQFAVKVGTALGLALLLALGAQALLASISPDLHMPPVRLQLQLACVVTAFTVGSLYVSSLSTSGLRALLVSVPAIVGAAWFLQYLVEFPGSAVFAIVSGLPTGVTSPGGQRVDQGLMGLVPVLIAGGFLVIVLRFALTNHRAADRAAARVSAQAIWMALCLTAGITLLAAAGAFFRVSFI
jgi:hypothetical protein